METQFIKGPEGRKLAYRKSKGSGPGVMFLGGLMSDMQGTKATILEQFFSERGSAYIRFDYSGHGESDGDFTDGTISTWLEDAAFILNEVADGEQVLVGSSMGGWMMLLLALRHPEKVHSLVGIASAPDFTAEMYEYLDDQQKQELEEKGLTEMPSDYGDPYRITKDLIEDGQNHFLLTREAMDIACPVHLLHGMADDITPYHKSLEIAHKVKSDKVTVELVKDAVHNFSRDEDLARLLVAVGKLAL